MVHLFLNISILLHRHTKYIIVISFFTCNQYIRYIHYTHTCGRHCIVVYWRILHHVPHVNRNLGRSKDLHWGLDLRLLATRPKETSWTQLTPNRRPKVRPLAVRIRVWLGGTRSAERRVRRVGQLWGGEGDPRFAYCGHEVAHDGWSGIHVGNPIPKKKGREIQTVIRCIQTLREETMITGYETLNT